MAAAELPLSGVTNVTRVLRTAVAASTSPFTLGQQVQDWGGEVWEYEIEFRAYQNAEGRRLSAFFAALGGMRDTFIFRDPFIENPGGLGTPLVNGGGQSGNALITDGWANRRLNAGDFIQLGTLSDTRLYQITADVLPSGGNATLQIVPALRASPADNSPLNVVNPGVLLRLTGPVPAAIGLADVYRFSITAREAL